MVCKKRIKVVFPIVMMCIFFTLFVGCKKTDTANATKTVNKDVILRIFNAKGENAEQFAEMCKTYSEETGITVEPFSVGSGTSALEYLRAQMSSKTPPAIYSVKGLTELPEWKESDAILDLAAVKDPVFAKIVNAIPVGLRLSSDGKENLGIPFNVEGFGYMVDIQMLNDLFGVSNGTNVLKDLRTCDYNEFVSFCDVVQKYTTNPSDYSVSLKGNTYKLQAQKTGRATNLTGVFAFAGSEKWTYGDHSVNVTLNMVFNSAGAAKAMTEDKHELLRAPFTAYMKNLDMVTSHVAGVKGRQERGQELINKATFGYDQSVQSYGDGKALFLQQGNWASANVAKVDADVANRSSFIPVKMPVTDDMIKTGQTAKDFNSSISVYVPNYYVINKKVSADEQEAAIDFMIWLGKHTNVQKFIINDFKSIPYNADSTYSIEDSYSKSIISYMEEGKVMSNPYMGVSKPWIRDVIAGTLMEKYLTKKEWTESDIKVFVDNTIAALKN